MYRLGLDIGITSVGWAVLATDENAEPYRIIDLGSRIFDAAEGDKGESLAKPRRDARSARRRNRRHAHRNQRIRAKIVQHGILTKKALSHLYDAKNAAEDIYRIRYEALERPLTQLEWARLLIHLAQRRGFKSNRKADDKGDQETGAMLSAISDNEMRMKAQGYRTVGEMLYKDKKFQDSKRNKAENYQNSVTRAQMIDEIRLVFEKQRTLGNAKADKAFEEAYLSIFAGQRAFEEGPGSGPYSGNQIEKMIGRCTFEPNEPRCAKAAYSFERWNLLQNINRMMLVDEAGKRRMLTPAERKQTIELAHKVDALSYARIRKELALPEDMTFSGLTYGRKGISEVEKKAKFQFLKHYHALRKALDKIQKGLIKECPVSVRDAIGDILTKYKTDEKIKLELDQLSDPWLSGARGEAIKNAVLTLPSASGFGNLSLKAIKKMLPHLEQGLMYDKAAEAADYDFRGHFGGQKTELLPPLPQNQREITSPVVKRAISQTIQVVNAIVKKYGSPMAVNIELAREMSKSYKDRMAIKKIQDQNRKENEKAVKKLKEDFNQQNPKGQDILKLRLWEEQDGICPYSGEKIERVRLLENGYAEIDHIVPYSISWDDRYSNKVLVLSRENQHKRDRLPLKYLTGQKRDQFIVRAKGVRNLRKRQNLLRETFDNRSDFKERNLNDTKFISRFMYNYFNDHLLMDARYSKKKKVTACNGAVTAYLRKRWGLSKVREDGDLHHAMDACVIGSVTDGLIQEVTEYFKWHEGYATNPKAHLQAKQSGKEQMPLPWPDFRDEVQIRLSEDPVSLLRQKSLRHYQKEDIEKVKPVFVSRMKKKKTTGPVHEATYRGLREIDGVYYSVSKTALSELTLQKDGTIKDLDRSEDPAVYDAIKARLLEFGGDAKKAFEKPLYKPSAPGKQAPQIKKVKIRKKITDGVVLNNGKAIAENGPMIRVDLYQVNEKGKNRYYGVPVYVKDMIGETRPDLAAVQGKPKARWKKMQPADFLFSIYPNEVLKITFKKSKTARLVNNKSTLPATKEYGEFFGYFKAFNIANAQIQTIINHDKTYQFQSLGIKTLPKIEKYGVDVLGNLYPVGRERR